MTVVPLFLITVGIGGLVRRVVAFLLSSFLFKVDFLEYSRCRPKRFLCLASRDHLSKERILLKMLVFYFLCPSFMNVELILWF